MKDKDIRKDFQRLSVRYGGNLFCNKTLLEQQEVAVFFGLGGLGCRAVREIKAASNRCIDEPNHRFYMCVDTCLADLKNLSFDNIMTSADEEDSDVIESYSFKEEEILYLHPGNYRNGANGIRELGRSIFLQRSNQENTYSKISELLHTARTTANYCGKRLRVYIIAGLGGGTGSGIITDFSYMVRTITAIFSENHPHTSAIIFTPDVQYNDIGFDEKRKIGLRANFYGALREIDYYIEAVARNIEYENPVNHSISRENIFDDCTIVSGYTDEVQFPGSSDEIIKKLADSLIPDLASLCDTTSMMLHGRPFHSILYYRPNYEEFWRLNNLHGYGLKLPDRIMRGYRSFSHSSFYIPINEWIAYGADLHIKRLFSYWNDRDIEQKDIDELLRKNSLKSNRMFADKLFDLASLSVLFDEIEKSELPVDGFAFLPVKNCHSYLELLKYIALAGGHERRIDKHLNKIYRKIEATFVDPLVKTVNEAFTDEKKGPVYAINLLFAGNAGTISEKKGILRHIKELYENLNAEIEIWSLELHDIYQKLTEKADSYDGKITVPSSVLESFTNDCYNYGTNLLKCSLLAHSKTLLLEIYNHLNKNNLFQTYTDTLYGISDMLNKDAEFTLSENRRRIGDTVRLKFDMADNEHDNKTLRLKEFFNCFVNSRNIKKDTKAFSESIFGEIYNRFSAQVSYYDTKKAITPADITAIVAKYFSNIFDGITSQLLCIMAYSDAPPTPEKISEILNDQALRNMVLSRAADAVKNKLSGDGRLMITSANTEIDINEFSASEIHWAPAECPELTQMVTPFYIQSMPYGCEYTSARYAFNFPIWMLYDLDRCRTDYEHCQENLSTEFHQDNNYSAFIESLPEPFDYMAAVYLDKYTPGGHDITEKDRKKMTDLFNLASEAKEAGVLVPTSFGHHDQSFFTIRQLDRTSFNNSSELKNRIFSAAAQLREEGKNTDVSSVLDKAGFEFYNGPAIHWHFVWSEYNIMRNCNDLGTTDNFGNLIVLLYSNPGWAQSLREETGLFRKISKIINEVLLEK